MVMQSSWTHVLIALLFAFASFDAESLATEGELHEHAAAAEGESNIRLTSPTE